MQGYKQRQISFISKPDPLEFYKLNSEKHYIGVTVS